MNRIGIYCIRNIVNNHVYIGSSVNITKRIRNHFGYLRTGKHRNCHLQHAYDKYGECNFRFRVLKLCETQELLQFEQYFIDLYNPEYNITHIAGRVEMTDSMKHKISESMTPDIRDHISKVQKGIPRPYMLGTQHAKGHRWSEHDKQRIAKQSTGRKHTDESKQKISMATVGNKRGQGHKWSEQEKQEISIRMKGNKRRVGCRNSDKHKQAISNYMKTRGVSEETRRKTSESMRKYWKEYRKQQV